MPRGRGGFGRGYRYFTPGFGRGLGYGFFGWGRGLGNAYPFCRWFPWLPRWWWAYPAFSQPYYGGLWRYPHYAPYWPSPYTTPYSYSPY